MLAAVSEFGLDAAGDAVVGVAGDTNTANLADLLQARRDVDAVAEDIITLDDDVAQVHADAKADGVFGGAACRRSPRFLCTF